MHTLGLDLHAWDLIAPPGASHPNASNEARTSSNSTLSSFIENTSGRVPSPQVVLHEALRHEYPHAHITMAQSQVSFDLLNFAQAGNASAVPREALDPAVPSRLTSRSYIPPLRRMDEGQGEMVENVIFGSYVYHWEDKSWLLYYVRCREGMEFPYDRKTHFLVSGEGIDVSEKGNGASTEELQAADDSLIKAATTWGERLHNSIWVFNSGYWQQDHELYKNIMKARWEDVIMKDEQKQVLQNDANRFFDSQARYERLRVPWKRGVIYYGPPGNGKTISIKAMMGSLYKRRDPVAALYVRSLASFGGPEYAIRLIFQKARQNAPCLLIFEDLDSLVTPAVRSYFLNEVDGLASNDGILMVGSTNHLELLDPGISKRPSRFDRKFLFENPDLEQRTQYAEFWRHKLGHSSAAAEHSTDGHVQMQELSLGGSDDYPDIEFPKQLSPKIASITQGFSFAYMQEAFIASLLAIAAEEEGSDTCDCGRTRRIGSKEDFEQLKLWREIQKQVKELREEM